MVIKIPEETYKNIQSCDWKNEGRWISEEWRAIHHGTLLPKGHGKLIDADAEIIKIMKIKEMAKSSYDVYDGEIACLRLAPTIIEADKAESENKE